MKVSEKVNKLIDFCRQQTAIGDGRFVCLFDNTKHISCAGTGLGQGGVGGPGGPQQANATTCKWIS